MYIDDLTDAVVACAEAEGWKVEAGINYKEHKEQNTLFEFSKFNPGGRDFSFEVEMKCANINSLIERTLMLTMRHTFGLTSGDTERTVFPTLTGYCRSG